MKLRPNETVVLEGTYLYDGETECGIRIVYSPVRHRTVDHDEPPEIEEDIYYVDYGSPVKKGEFASRSGTYSSLDEAVKNVWRVPAIGKTVRWQNPPPGLDLGKPPEPKTPAGAVLRPDETIVLEGTYLYDGEIECAICVVHGRYCAEDEASPEFSEGGVVGLYFVRYGSPVDRGRFYSSSSYPSLAEAVTDVWRVPAMARTVQWRSPPAGLDLSPPLSREATRPLLRPNETVVISETYLYAGEIECDIYVVHSPIRYGASIFKLSYDDPPELQEDVAMDTYYLLCGSPVARGRDSSRIYPFPSLAEAMEDFRATIARGLRH